MAWGAANPHLNAYLVGEGGRWATWALTVGGDSRCCTRVSPRWIITDFNLNSQGNKQDFREREHAVGIASGQREWRMIYFLRITGGSPTDASRTESVDIRTRTMETEN